MTWLGQRQSCDHEIATVVSEREKACETYVTQSSLHDAKNSSCRWVGTRINGSIVTRAVKRTV